MTWDRHTEFDAWEKALGGPGANPNDAFGKLIASTPNEHYGMFVGAYRETDMFITAFTTNGIFWYRKADQAVGFARAEEALPLV